MLYRHEAEVKTIKILYADRCADGRMHGPLNTSNYLRLLALQLDGITLMALLPAVLQTFAFMVLEHTVLAAEVSLAKIAVADDALR